MSGNNKSAYPFYIITGALVCLVALSQFDNIVSYAGFKTRPLDMLADLRPDSLRKQQQEDDTPIDSSMIPQIPTEDSTETAADLAADSTLATELADVPDPDKHLDFTDYKGIISYNLPPTADTAAAGLQHFLDALAQLKQGKRKKVRIAYFGDSMIEGDLLTEDLRDSLQRTFGGSGVGFVPITSVVAGFRTTITHTFSKDWKDYSYKQQPPADIKLGISGHTFVPSGNSYVRYTPVHKKRLDKFERVTLFYGPAGNANITINDKAYTLKEQNLVNRFVWSQDPAQNNVTIKWAGGSTTPFYGVSFEGDSGVYVDNFSFRGISGIELGKLSKTLVQEMQNEHPYDLVILQYGANILFKPKLTDYSWYAKPMKKVIDSLRKDMPGTSFLVISTADKSYKNGGDWVTAPGVMALLKDQHELAKQHGTAYWNLYAAMGGEGTMAKWVDGDPVLAQKDHTHFNRQGAAKVAALLYKAMMDEFKQLEIQ